MMNFEATELRLGLPGSDDKSSPPVVRNNKRPSSEIEATTEPKNGPQQEATPSKTQVVGWPPVRSYRKNCFQAKKTEEAEQSGSGIYVKVSMDGAPYLRKMDLKFYKGYPELLKAMEAMFKCSIGVYSEREGYKGSDFAPTYEDKDGDWMLVGDVPWEMFATSCKRLRIMKGSEAKGLGCL